MATGTLSPDAKQTFLDTNGNPLVSGKLFTYIAGTTTAVATYTDVGLTVANANPIILDTAGRCVIFLSPGGSYKYVLQDSTGAAVWTQDNISTIPSNAGNVDLAGIAGEAITAGQAVYLSDGSGGKQAGQWYKGDSTNTYSSSLAVEVGMAPAAVASGASGTMRAAGSVSGLSVVTGTTYYIGTAGAITSSAPANLRQIGIADTTSTLVLSANPGVPNSIAPVARGGTGLAAGTSGGVLAYTATGTLASSALLTAHGVVIGGGAGVVPTSTGAGTSGQVLTSNGPSADPTFQATSGTISVLLSTSGTDTNASADDFATVAISGLTQRDSLKVVMRMNSQTQATAGPFVRSSTDSVNLTAAGAALVAGVAKVYTYDIFCDPFSTLKAISQKYESDTSDIFITAAFTTRSGALTTPWTGSWTLALRQGGVTAGGTLNYSVTVYKVAGQ